MSSTVNMDMALISAANLLPHKVLCNEFFKCIEDLNGKIVNNSLFFENECLGRISTNNRIVLSFQSDYDTQKRMYYRKKIRDAFNKRIGVVHQNYIFELEQQKESLKKQAIAEKELLESLERVERTIEQSKKAYERQQLDECEALKAEIVDAAVAQGYEVIEEKKENGIQLQFIRRDY